MSPSDLPAVLHAMRQAVDEAAPDLAFVEIIPGGPGEVLPVTERLAEAAVNALPALIEHAADVIDRHFPTYDGEWCIGCGIDALDWRHSWPCCEIQSLAAALEPYSTLLAEEKANGDL